MSTSDGTENRFELALWNQVFDHLSRYDVLLAVVPLLFAVSLVVHVLTPVPFEVAMAGGALSSTVCLLDAVVLNPPTDVSADR
jgi:hypothetical protein